MRLEPLRNWIIGRIAITKVSSAIVLSDVTKNVTKFILIDEVSPEAEQAGFKPGDLVMPEAMSNIFLKGGTLHRVTCPIDKLVCRVSGVSLDEFVGSDGNPIEKEQEVAA